MGRLTVAAATLADVAAVLLLTLLFPAGESTAGARVVLLITFLGVVGLTAAAVLASERWGRLTQCALRLEDTTAEIRVRAADMLLLAFVVMAAHFGLEAIRGALLAGVVIGAVDKDSASHPRVSPKPDAIGYGFLIPTFFISSGTKRNVGGLVEDPAALVRMPVLLLGLLVCLPCFCAGSSREARPSRRACCRRRRCHS